MTQPANFMGTVETVPVNLPATSPATALQPGPVAAPEPVPAAAPPEADVLPPLEDEADILPPLENETVSMALGAEILPPLEDDTLPPLESGAPEMSAMQAFTTSVPRGAFFGMSDELEGGISVLLDKYYGISAQNLELAKKGFKVGGPTSSTEVYKADRDVARAKLNAAMEQHPLASLAGAVMGGVLVPGIGTLSAFTSAGAKGAIAAGGLEGAIGGFGESTAKALPDELTMDEIKALAADAAVGGALGASGVAALGLLGKGIKRAVGGKASDTTVMPTRGIEDDIETRAIQRVMDNKDEINALAELMPIAKVEGVDVDDFATFMKTVGDGTDAEKALLTGEVKAQAAAARAWEEPTSFTINQSVADDIGARTVDGAQAKLIDMAAEVDPIVQVMQQLKTAGKQADAAKVAAYVKYKSEVEDFVDWLQPRTMTTVGKGPEAASSMADKIDYARRQGMMTPKMFKAYKVVQAVDEMSSKVARSKFGADDLVNSIDYMRDLKYVVRRIDDKLGIGVEDALNQVATGVANYKTFALAEDKLISQVSKAARKTGLDMETVTRALDVGEVSDTVRANLTPKQAEAVADARKYLDDFLQKMNDMGLPVEKRENYITHSMKRGADLILAVRNKADELGGAGLSKVSDVSFDSALHKAADKWEVADLQAASPETKALVEYKLVLEKLFNTELNSKQAILDASKALFSDKQIAQVRKKALGYEATAAMARKGFIPDWVRERDFERLTRNMMVNASKAIHVNPALKIVEAHIPILRNVGYKDAAKYLTNYVSDMSGASSRKIGFIQDAALRYELWAKTALKGAPQDIALLVPHMFGMLGQQIYPNLLGLNLKGVNDNLLAPFTSGASGLASASNARVIPYAMKQAMKSWVEMAMNPAITVGKTFNVVKAVKAAEAALAKEGFAQPGITPRDIDALREPIRKGLIGAGIRVTDKLTAATMWMFNHSEILSKYVSLKTIDRIADDFFSASTKAKAGAAITKSEQNALDAIATFPRSIRRRAALLPEKEARQMLRQHYINQTSLVYGKAGASEFARDWGNVLSMLSKWPVSVISDLSYTMRSMPAQDAAKVLVQKYMYPYVALGTIGTLIAGSDPKAKVRMEEAFGAGGPEGRTPIASIAGIRDFGKTPIVQSGFGVLDAMDGARAMAKYGKNTKEYKDGKRKLKKAANDSIKLYAPWTVYKRGYEHTKSLYEGRRFRFDEKK
jgi:hypothetical protein